MDLFAVGGRYRTAAEKGYLGRVVPNFPKQAVEFGKGREERGQGEDGMEKGKLGRAFKAKCMLGMKWVGGDICPPS